MKKKILIFSTFIALLICLFAITAFAIEIDGIYYSLNEEEATATVTADNATQCTLENVVIPSTFEYNSTTYTVTSIAAHAFSGSQGSWGKNQTIKSLYIPETVTSLGNHFLRECKSIESVTIKSKSESGISLSNAEFYNCTSLKTIDVKDSDITAFGSYAFYGCSSLTNFVFPKRVASIGHKAFQGCSSLTALDLIDIPVTTIESWAFNSCSKLAEIKLPVTLQSVGNNCFQGTPMLTKLVFPDTFNSLANDAVAQIPVAMVVFPELSESHAINAGAFHECGSLNVVIYEGTNYEVLTGSGKVFSAYTALPFSSYNPNTTYTKTLFYGATLCTKCNGLLGQSCEMFDGEKYTSNYVNAKACQNCAKNNISEVLCGPLFVNLGYSKSEDDSAFTYGITLNEDNIKEYQTITGKTLSYGFIVGKAGTEAVSGEIVSILAESLIANSIITNFTQIQYENLNVYRIKMTKIETEAQKTLPIYCNMYISDGETVSYVGAVDSTYKPTAITLKNLPTKE